MAGSAEEVTEQAAVASTNGLGVGVSVNQSAPAALGWGFAYLGVAAWALTSAYMKFQGARAQFKS